MFRIITTTRTHKEGRVHFRREVHVRSSREMHDWLAGVAATAIAGKEGFVFLRDTKASLPEIHMDNGTVVEVRHADPSA